MIPVKGWSLASRAGSSHLRQLWVESSEIKLSKCWKVVFGLGFCQPYCSTRFQVEFCALTYGCSFPGLLSVFSFFFRIWINLTTNFFFVHQHIDFFLQGSFLLVCPGFQMMVDITEAALKSRDNHDRMWDITAQPSAHTSDGQYCLCSNQYKFIQKGQRPCQGAGPFWDDLIMCVCLCEDRFSCALWLHDTTVWSGTKRLCEQTEHCLCQNTHTHAQMERESCWLNCTVWGIHKAVGQLPVLQGGNMHTKMDCVTSPVHANMCLLVRRGVGWVFCKETDRSVRGVTYEIRPSRWF